MGNIVDVTEGTLLVVSDIHGNYSDYERAKALFRELQAQGRADRLVLNGGLIHAPVDSPDESKEILDDLIDNCDPAVIAALGKNEFAHIYHMEFSEGERNFVEPFEDAIEANRERYVGCLKGMPFAVRTSGGVVITHAGANPPMAGYHDDRYGTLVAGKNAFKFMNDLSHDKLLELLIQNVREGMERDGNVPAPGFFDDYTPEIGQLFLRTNIGQYLCDVFFNKNEHQFKDESNPELYGSMVARYLDTMSNHGLGKMDLLVSGHIEVPNGFEVVAGRQLRISSFYRASLGKGAAVLVNAANRYSMEQLVEGIVPIK